MNYNIKKKYFILLIFVTFSCGNVKYNNVSNYENLRGAKKKQNKTKQNKTKQNGSTKSKKTNGQKTESKITDEELDSLISETGNNRKNNNDINDDKVLDLFKTLGENYNTVQKINDSNDTKYISYDSENHMYLLFGNFAFHKINDTSYYCGDYPKGIGRKKDKYIYYTGQMINETLNGFGVIYNSEDNILYAGQVCDNKAQGLGFKRKYSNKILTSWEFGTFIEDELKYGITYNHCYSGKYQAYNGSNIISEIKKTNLFGTEDIQMNFTKKGSKKGSEKITLLISNNNTDIRNFYIECGDSAIILKRDMQFISISCNRKINDNFSTIMNINLRNNNLLQEYDENKLIKEISYSGNLFLDYKNSNDIYITMGTKDLKETPFVYINKKDNNEVHTIAICKENIMFLEGNSNNTSIRKEYGTFGLEKNDHAMVKEQYDNDGKIVQNILIKDDGSKYNVITINKKKYLFPISKSNEEEEENDIDESKKKEQDNNNIEDDDINHDKTNNEEEEENNIDKSEEKAQDINNITENYIYNNETNNENKEDNDDKKNSLVNQIKNKNNEISNKISFNVISRSKIPCRWNDEISNKISFDNILQQTGIRLKDCINITDLYDNKKKRLAKNGVNEEKRKEIMKKIAIIIQFMEKDKHKQLQEYIHKKLKGTDDIFEFTFDNIEKKPYRLFVKKKGENNFVIHYQIGHTEEK